MNGYTLSVAIEKGGSGKTTALWGLGEQLHKAGRKVLYVDMDAQGSLSRLLKADASKPTIYDMLIGNTRASNAIQPTEQGDLIASSPKMGGMGTVLSGTGREYRLREVLEDVTERYDIVLIDTPPALGIQTICALTASDGVIIPMKADIMTLQGMEAVLATVGTVQRYTNPDLEVLGIAIMDWDGRPALTKQIAELIEARASNIPTCVFKTRIRHGIAIQEAQAIQKGIGEYSPKSNPARDIEAFSKEVAARIELNRGNGNDRKEAEYQHNRSREHSTRKISRRIRALSRAETDPPEEADRHTHSSGRFRRFGGLRHIPEIQGEPLDAQRGSGILPDQLHEGAQGRDRPMQSKKHRP